MVFALILSGTVFAEEKKSEDWLMFNHDPARTGHTSNEASPPFLTRMAYQATDSIRSSIAITERYAVVGSHDNSIYCYDTDSFRIKWSFKTGDAVQSSPTIAGNVVLCGSDDGYLYCINLKQAKSYSSDLPLVKSFLICFTQLSNAGFISSNSILSPETFIITSF